MKLSRIRVSQFQQFRETLEVADLNPGLNLFAGPNESGKSTLARAIRTAFFERYRTGTLEYLQPWGDSSAAPEVMLEFDWQGNAWRLEKRFVKQARCDLQGDGRHLSGDEAEAYLADLFGFQFASRGASRAEHWGIPGLLWVEQGVGQEVHEPVGHASQHLQSALAGNLGDAVGELASSSGDALIRQVERERAELLTATGRPTGRLREAQQLRDTLASELSALNDQVREYSEQVDRLGALQRQQQESDVTRPWEAQREKAEAALQQLQAVERLREQQTQSQRQLDDCRRHQQLYRQQLQDFERQIEALAGRERERTVAQQRLEGARANDVPVQQRLDASRVAYDQARETLARARRYARRQALQGEHAQLTRQLEGLDSTLEQATALRDALQQLAEQYQAQVMDESALKQLREQEQQLAGLMVQQQALATRLGYSLEHAQQLELGDRTLTDEGEVLLLEEAVLRIPGLGTLTIKPGGTDVAELLREQRRVEMERDALLQQLGVADLATAEARVEVARELQQRLGRERARLEGLAPEGVEALQAQRALALQRRDRLSAELAELPPAEHDETLPSEAEAEASLETAGAALKAAENAEVAQRRDVGLAQQALDAADKEWRSLRDQLNVPDRRQREQQARDALTDLRSQEQSLAAQLQARQREIDAANPELLGQDVERFSRAADAMQQQATRRTDEIQRLQIGLETLGAQGLEERQAERRQQLERQQLRCDELERRAAALDLLLNLLREQRQVVTRRLQAPLQKHLNRYLNLLFPGAELTIDQNLKPQTLRRVASGVGEDAELEALSFGAREQMGLISRLAYADLLREAGRPTLIMLDDALVHCDQARREQMQRILFDAAQRHQILLFTCHPENWQDLGVVSRDMQALKVSTDSTHAAALEV